MVIVHQVVRKGKHVLMWQNRQAVPLALLLGALFLLAGCRSAKVVDPARPTVTPVTHAGTRVQVGWYTNEKLSLQRISAYRRAGVTLLVTYYIGEPYTSRWVQAAGANHIRLLLEPDPAWIEQDKLDELQAFVRRYRHEPAVYGWYLFDEPDLNQLPPPKLQAGYRAIKALDGHPIAVVFTTGQCLFGQGAIDPAYLAGFDLLMFDRYPFYTNLPDVHPLQDERKIDANCVQSARITHKLGPIMVLQGFGKGQKDGPFTWRDPTYQETLCSFRVALAAGALGVLFYSDQYADDSVRHNVDHIIRLHRDAPGSASGKVAATRC
jgi:hypothetical protein